MSVAWQKLFVPLLSLSMWSASAAAQIDPAQTDNIASIRQIGDYNSTTVEQDDGQNQALISLVGNANAASIRQGGADGGNKTNIDTQGDSNQLNVEQSKVAGFGINTADVALLGASNVLAIIQNYTESASTTVAGDNSAVVSQTGNNNQMTLDQNGSNNVAKLGQTGNENDMNVSQQQDGNSAEITQTGNGLSISVVQSESGPPVIINQVN